MNSDRILSALQEARTKLEAADLREREPIAIVGMAGRFPGAECVAEFWEDLKAGVAGIRDLSDEELLASGVTSDLWEQPNFVRAYASPKSIAGFDAGLFGYSPHEAELMDPQHRLFLESAWESLEHAGYDSEQYAGRIAVYGGASLNGYLINLHSDRNLRNNLDPVQVVVSNALGLMPMRVAHKLNFTGVACGVQTGCSTSLVAVHLACQSLRQRDCDMALAGGSSVGILNKSGYLHQPDSILSPDGVCRAFDAEAQGTVFGNGVGVVVLKRLSDAIADGDEIYATILATAVNNDGAQKVGLTAPSVVGQAEVIAMAFKKAKVSPESISYLETHGTGTPIGDPIEIAALQKVYGQHDRPYCAIGSVKSSVGHLDAAAGVTGLIKIALMLHHRQLPPSLNFKTPNPKIDFAQSAFQVNTKLKDWTVQNHPHRAALSSFGMGGTNAHAILQAAPPKPESSPSKPFHILTLSAKTSTALNTICQNLATYFKNNPHLNLADVAYTLNRGRKSLDQRKTIIAATLGEAIVELEKNTNPMVPVNLPIAFLFSGQGSQYARMGWDLYEHEPLFREWLDRGFAILKAKCDLDLKSVLYEQTDANLLNQTQYSQPAIFLIEYALSQLLIEWGIVPQALLGHSIGEYVAATLAQVFSFEQAIVLVAKRGKLMQDCEPGTMLSMSASVENMMALLIPDTYLSVINAPNLCVVSGRESAIVKLESELLKYDISHRRLHTSHAFHSPMMKPAAEQLAQYLETLTLRSPDRRWISNLTGDWITPQQAIDPQYWAAHLLNPVQFSQGLTCLQQMPHFVLEVGAGQTLCTLSRQNGISNPVSTMRHPQDPQSDMAQLLKAIGQVWLNGVQVNWAAFYAQERRQRLALPTYPFERQDYWISLQTDSDAIDPAIDSEQTSKELSDYFYLPTWQRSPWIQTGDRDITSGSNWQIYCGDRDLAETWVKMAPRSLILGGLEEKLEGNILYILSDGDRDVRDFVELLQKLAMRSEPTRITVITCEAQSVLGAEVLNAAQSMIYGFCRVLTQEHSHISCQLIDLDSELYSSPSQNLFDELFCDAADRYSAIAYRHHQRWQLSYSSIQLPDVSNPKLSIYPEQFYTIAGDLVEGLGMVYAEWVGREKGAKLLLLGRSTLPVMADWETWLATHGAQDPTSHWIGEMQQLRNSGVDFEFFPVDLTDSLALTETITNYTHPIAGVIYAGTMGDRNSCLIKDVTPEVLEHQIEHKIQSVLNLEAAFQDQSIEFFLLQSSLSSIVGGVGFAAYAAAHCYLDSLAHHHHRSQNWISLNWDAVQMTTETTGNKWLDRGIARTEVGVLTQRVLSHRGLSQIAISPITIEARLQQSADSPIGNQYDRPTLSTQYIAPRDAIEQRVAELMQSLLGIEKVGVDDNFFELGGHSLLAIQAVTQLRSEFKMDLPMRQFLFESPTVAGIATLVSHHVASEAQRSEGLQTETENETERLLRQIEEMSADEAQQLLS